VACELDRLAASVSQKRFELAPSFKVMCRRLLLLAFEGAKKAKSSRATSGVGSETRRLTLGMSRTRRPERSRNLALITRAPRRAANAPH